MHRTLLIGAALDLAHSDFYVGLIKSAEHVIALDGGIAACRAASSPPDLLVGDMDSASPDDVQWAQSSGARVHRLEPIKDETDLEIGLTLCPADTELTATGVLGLRLDHELAAISAIFASHPNKIVIREPATTAWPMLAPAKLRLRGIGTIVSLLAWSGPATVTLEGMEYPLNRETLAPFSPRGVSNTVLAEEASIELIAGELLVVSPVLDFPPSMGYATPRTDF